MAKKDSQTPKGREGFANTMAKKNKLQQDMAMNYSEMDPDMAETIKQDMARRAKIKNLTEPAAAVTYGNPSQGTTPKEVPTDKHWQEVEREIQSKRAIVKRLRAQRTGA